MRPSGSSGGRLSLRASLRRGLLLLPHPDPERPCLGVVAVHRGIGADDHFRRHPDRQFRAWLVLHDRRLSRRGAVRRLHGRMVRGRVVLGRHRRGGAGRRADRGAHGGRAAAAHLQGAGAVPVAGDLRAGPRDPGRGGLAVRPAGHPRPARAGPARLGDDRGRALSPVRTAAGRGRPPRPRARSGCCSTRPVSASSFAPPPTTAPCCPRSA